MPQRSFGTTSIDVEEWAPYIGRTVTVVVTDRRENRDLFIRSAAAGVFAGVICHDVDDQGPAGWPILCFRDGFSMVLRPSGPDAFATVTTID